MWSHRRWIFSNFIQPLDDIDAVKEEIVFAHNWIDRDVRNSSPWNYRRAPLDVLLGKATDGSARRPLILKEINEIFERLVSAPTNGAAWSYLFGLMGDPFSMSEHIDDPTWSDALPLIKARILAHPRNRWALTAYAFALVSLEKFKASIRLMKFLVKVDPIKAGLWRLRIHLIQNRLLTKNSINHTN